MKGTAHSHNVFNNYSFSSSILQLFNFRQGLSFPTHIDIYIYISVSYTFEFIVVFIHVCVGWGGWGMVSFHRVLCAGCFGGTVLYMCIEYHI